MNCMSIPWTTITLAQELTLIVAATNQHETSNFKRGRRQEDEEFQGKKGGGGGEMAP